jgi:Domain of unknown function (DUF4352)
MTMYQGRQSVPSKQWKIWPWVTTVMIIVGICGVCALAAVFKLDEMTSSTGVEPSATMGQQVRDGDLLFVVEKVDCSAVTVGAVPVVRKAQGKFCVVSLSVSNRGDTARTFVSLSQKAFDQRGREYSADDAAGLLVMPQSWVSQINPGSKMSGVLVFDVPGDVELVSVVLHDGTFSSGVKVMIG